MYRDIVRILFATRTNFSIVRISKYTILHFRVSRIELATFWLVDSRVCHLNFQFCNFSNFNLPTSPFSFTNFRFSSFNFQRCVFQTCNIQFFKFPSQQKFSLQANNHRQVVRYFSIEKFVTVLFHDRENIGKVKFYLSLRIDSIFIRTINRFTKEIIASPWILTQFHVANSGSFLAWTSAMRDRRCLELPGFPYFSYFKVASLHKFRVYRWNLWFRGMQFRHDATIRC